MCTCVRWHAPSVVFILQFRFKETSFVSPVRDMTGHVTCLLYSRQPSMGWKLARRKLFLLRCNHLLFTRMASSFTKWVNDYYTELYNILTTKEEAWSSEVHVHIKGAMKTPNVYSLSEHLLQGLLRCFTAFAIKRFTIYSLCCAANQTAVHKACCKSKITIQNCYIKLEMGLPGLDTLIWYPL